MQADRLRPPMESKAVVRVRRALISVSDKRGLVELGRALVERGVELVSTGGTARALGEGGVSHVDVAHVTSFPEMLDGRVKTLHPAVHGGLLARRDCEEHMDAIAARGIAPIDLVVVNLYPFEATVMRGADRADIIENIDIGGPAMVRSAAKNHDAVAVVTDPDDYAALVAELDAHGGTTLEFRRQLAARAFAATATYDAMVASWFAFGDMGERFPGTLPLVAHRRQELRYGENPHQAAALYVPAGPRIAGVAGAELIQGKALSYNNLDDASAAFELIGEFRDAPPTVAIIKHSNPCGVAQGGSLAEAHARALACDPVSAYGGIVAVNRPLDGEAARAITALFTEVVVAPVVGEAAREVLRAKANLRVLETGALPDPARGGLTLKTIAGGYLVQARDGGRLDWAQARVVTERAPTEAERADMELAWTVAKHVKSNAIVYAKDGATAGIGAGQMNRRDAARIAAMKAREAAEAAGWERPMTEGSAVASDAFFPFADGLEAAVEAGATAVIQPGGSIRDGEVIAAADRAGLAMVFTGQRHFRH